MILPREIVVDSFAGGGGASSGIERALGRSPDIAINHNAEAIYVHRMNHPETRHYTEDVWKVDPREAADGSDIGLMWLSPDCTHFSRAKGGKPVSRKIRGLAWVAVRWADSVRPRVLCLENVPEFMTWGPLGPDGHPCSRQKGLTFKQFTGRLRNLGYSVEYRTLRACDFGAPTSRTRLFMVARSDGQPVRWPKPLYGPGRLRPWRTAAECIDWSIPCPSIFDRERPLAENTLKRIAAGIRRFVVETPQPFIVNMAHGGKLEPINQPISTIATEKGGCRALVAPSLIQMGYGEREGQAPRILNLNAPLGTVTAGGRKHGLVAAFLAKHYGGHTTPGSSLHAPMDTITSQDHHALVKAFLIRFYSEGGQWGDLRKPMHTITGKDRLGLVTVHGVDYAIVDIGMRMLQPRELFNAQGFDTDYEIEHGINDAGEIVPITKTAQVRLCGNSVCPDLSDAIVSAQFGGDYEMDLFTQGVA